MGQVGLTPERRVAISGVAKTITFTQSQFYQAWFWLFGYFWVTQFIAALGEMVLAGAAAAWYFRELPDRPPVKKPLMSALKRAVKYHIGSVAFGSLIIAIIKFIRAVIAYIQSKCNKAADKAGAIGKMVKMVLCLIQSCLWCMEKCMKFINRNAYVLIAIHGISFCTAAKRSFFLILRNIARIGAVAMLSTIFLLHGREAFVLPDSAQHRTHRSGRHALDDLPLSRQNVRMRRPDCAGHVLAGDERLDRRQRADHPALRCGGYHVPHRFVHDGRLRDDDRHHARLLRLRRGDARQQPRLRRRGPRQLRDQEERGGKGRGHRRRWRRRGLRVAAAGPEGLTDESVRPDSSSGSGG